MDDLKKLAFEKISAHIDSLAESELVEEVFSGFASRQVIPTKVVAQLLTYPVDTQNFTVSISSDSDWVCPNTKPIFGTN